jgi:hypothetical protein
MGKTPANRKQDQTLEFLADVFGLTAPKRREMGDGMEMPGVLRLKNQPEFWADAPWRLEPDQEMLPVSFCLRDGDIQPPGKGPWRLKKLKVDQRLSDDDWSELISLLPADLRDVDAQGYSRCGFWVYGIKIPIQALQGIKRGDTVHLRCRFEGRFPGEEHSDVEIHLETLLAEHGLPEGRAAHKAGPRHWFYGDTHYHSGYTDDVKEYGGTVPEARKAGKAIGLDWLIVTDHSSDLDEPATTAAGQCRASGPVGQSRWERLSEEVVSPEISDDSFRCILGEEISLLGKAGYPLHMLAFGAMSNMIEGAFLPTTSDDFKVELVRWTLEQILKIACGYPSDIPERLFGTIHRFEKVLELLGKDTLLFAAHPYDPASVPPACWGASELTHPRLTGYEFWNGRIRVAGRHTYNPFERPSWNNPEKLQSADAARISSLKQRAQKRWDPQLQRGTGEWRLNDPLPRWRPVFIGGSDAHGDFNYHAGWAWDYRRYDVDDNALGKVRTAVYLPEHTGTAVPPEDKILAALKRGACVVTDGPVVEGWLEQEGKVAHMGEALTIWSGSDPELKVIVHTTPELGSAPQVEVVTYFAGSQPQRTTVQLGTTAAVDMDGQRGYCRIEAQTAGPEGERFYCFTNPIWLRATDDKKRQLHISYR